MWPLRWFVLAEWCEVDAADSAREWCLSYWCSGLEFDFDVLAFNSDVIMGDISRCRCAEYGSAVTSYNTA